MYRNGRVTRLRDRNTVRVKYPKPTGKEVYVGATRRDQASSAVCMKEELRSVIVMVQLLPRSR